MELIVFAIIVVALVALVAQLNRNDRRSRRQPAESAHERYLIDRDVERVRADLMGAPERLATRPLWRVRPQPLTGTDEWTRQA